LKKMSDFKPKQNKHWMVCMLRALVRLAPVVMMYDANVLRCNICWQDTQFLHILHESLDFFNIPTEEQANYFLVDTKTSA